MLQNIAEIRPHTDNSASIRRLVEVPASGRVGCLTEADRREALSFLAVRPVQTVVMTSFILDNGMVSELHRGEFFGYRNAAGELEGIALIGHSTLVEARTEDALTALAIAARRSSTPIHLIMSNGSDAQRFHQYLTGGTSEPRLTCVEALFEARLPMEKLLAYHLYYNDHQHR